MVAPLDTTSLIQSAGAFAATQVASRVSPKILAKAGRAVGAVQSVLQFVNGNGAFFEAKTPLMGGISMRQARDMHDRMKGLDHARKNFFIVMISHLQEPKNSPELFMLFATDVAYSPYTVSGSGGVRMGAATMDEVDGAERIDLRITTMDDTSGSLKRWFREMASRAADRNTGTFGVPASYAISFSIYHAVVEGWDEGGDNRYSDPGVVQPYVQPYIDVMHMRTTSIETELSRREPGMQELQMTFSQIDTFMLGANVQR